MEYISCRITGVPYGRDKSRGNTDGLGLWSEAIVKQTEKLPTVKEACLMKVTFFLPPDKFPSDFPYGSDIDNLLKRLFDALNKTVFRYAIGKDSCVISLAASKTKVKSYEESGVYIEILPVKV